MLEAMSLSVSAGLGYHKPTCLYSKQQGGYDCELVDGFLLERYQCSVCMKLLRDARLTECCGQHFCDTCFQEKNKTCPHCRAKSTLNKEKIRDINQLSVCCTNCEKGSVWEGELRGLKDHLQLDNGCDYEIVECDYSGYKQCILYFSDVEEEDLKLLPCSKRVECRDLQTQERMSICPKKNQQQGRTQGGAEGARAPP